VRHPIRLDPKAFGLAAGIVAVVLFIAGLLGWGVGTALVFTMAAVLYNRLGVARG
jgi:hypothetical protein